MEIIVTHYCDKCKKEIEHNKEWRMMYDLHRIEGNYCLRCLTNMSGLKRKN